MKKKILLSIVLTSLFVLPLSALEHGPVLGAGVQGAINIYPYESAAYKFMWDDFGIDIGLTVLEDPIYQSPVVMFEPGINLYFNRFYLGGGLFISKLVDNQISGYARTGIIFGDWDWGIGKGDIDFGLAFSPTIILSGKEGLDVIGDLFASIFNIFKLNLGITYYIPIGQ